IAGAGITFNLPKKLFTAELKQEVKLLDAITIPGTNAATLTIDAKSKKLSLKAKAGISLTGAPTGPEALSLGIKDFLFDVTPYNTTNPVIKLNGAAYISLWTLGGFSGTIQNAVLDGKGNLNLPPGLNTLLGVKTISLPITADLRAGQTLAQLGGRVGDLAIKHFPLELPEIIVKNDGIHLKGKIGIANVITIPLGDLLFTQTESATSVKGDVGIGPFTLAEGNFTFPAGTATAITFEGKMGIPGLTGQKLSGSIYKDGKLEFTGLTKIGLINVDTMGKFSISPDKLKLHADTAGFGVGLGGLAKCSLAFTNLDITPSKISGTATGTFSNVLGIDTSLRGNFSFDGSTIELTYPSSVTLCGISVGDGRLSVGIGGVSGSGKISSGGKSVTVSITIENGILKLKGPLGELIAEGTRIVSNLAETTVEIASDEKEVIAEDAEGVINNLSRMSDPWIKELEGCGCCCALCQKRNC
ncbi:MAG: hypothetical protein NTW64_00105, partial [Candidatus Omnitrophica bacterium]|nr:hypothetical protein [Candidatus Omnitrophota bacterium]